MKVSTLILVSLLITVVFSHSAEEWSNRTIYQLLTDRFAKTNGDGGACDLSNYCGGTFAGIKNKLDYIVGMGFDAIWLSPIIKNTPGGYHGFWAQDLYQLNPNFGTESDLKELIDACHARDIWVMVGVVANHVGPVGFDYSTIVPFNQDYHYHNCDTCPSNCQISDWNNQRQVEICRLAGLPDLNQTEPFVRKTLLEWVRDLKNKYKFDGIRIDTVPEVAKDFWREFADYAGVFQIGEVFNGDVGYVASYQGVLDSVFNYPMFFTIRGVFGSHDSMYNIQNRLSDYKVFKSVGLLGSFLDNHDNARFLSFQGDYQLFKNALTYTVLAEGIPVIYYGSEQGYAGGNDPHNRETLWPNYNTNSDLYKFIATIVKFKKDSVLSSDKQIQRYADDTFYAFTRGNVFVALTNGGTNSGTIDREITYHPYTNGTKICNIFNNGDCITVQNGKFRVYLARGECKIYL